jgi:hypothetical protein
MINPNVVQSIIVEYTTTTNTIPQIATNHNLKPADVSAILRMNDIAVKRGPRDMANHPLLSPEVRAKRLASVRERSLRNRVRDLVEAHGYVAVADMLEEVNTEDMEFNMEGMDSNG